MGGVYADLSGRLTNFVVSPTVNRLSEPQLGSDELFKQEIERGTSVTMTGILYGPNSGEEVITMFTAAEASVEVMECILDGGLWDRTDLTMVGMGYNPANRLFRIDVPLDGLHGISDYGYLFATNSVAVSTKFKIRKRVMAWLQ